MTLTFRDIDVSARELQKVRSTCCGAKIQMRFGTVDTTAGKQFVYSCNQCGFLYVVREKGLV